MLPMPTDTRQRYRTLWSGSVCRLRPRRGSGRLWYLLWSSQSNFCHRRTLYDSMLLTTDFSYTHTYIKNTSEEFCLTHFIALFFQIKLSGCVPTKSMRPTAPPTIPCTVPGHRWLLNWPAATAIRTTATWWIPRRRSFLPLKVSVCYQLTHTRYFVINNTTTTNRHQSVSVFCSRHSMTEKHYLLGRGNFS